MSNFWETEPKKRPTKSRPKEALTDPMQASWAISSGNKTASADKNDKQRPVVKNKGGKGSRVTKTKGGSISSSESSDSDLDEVGVTAIGGLGFRVADARKSAVVGSTAGSIEDTSSALFRRGDIPSLNENSDRVHGGADEQYDTQYEIQDLHAVDPLLHITTVQLPAQPLRLDISMSAQRWATLLVEHVQVVMVLDVDVAVKQHRFIQCLQLLLVLQRSAGAALCDGMYVWFDKTRVEQVSELQNSVFFTCRHLMEEIRHTTEQWLPFQETPSIMSGTERDVGAYPFAVCNTKGSTDATSDADSIDQAHIVSDPHLRDRARVMLRFLREYKVSTGKTAVTPEMLRWQSVWGGCDEDVDNDVKNIFYGECFEHSVFSSPAETSLHLFNYRARTRRSPIAVRLPATDVFFDEQMEEEQGVDEVPEDVQEDTRRTHTQTNTCTCRLTPSYHSPHFHNCPGTQCTRWHVSSASLAVQQHAQVPTLLKWVVSASEAGRRDSAVALALLQLLTPTMVDNTLQSVTLEMSRSGTSAVHVALPSEWPNFQNTRYQDMKPRHAPAAYSSSLALRHLGAVRAHRENVADQDSFVPILPLLAQRIGAKKDGVAKDSHEDSPENTPALLQMPKEDSAVVRQTQLCVTALFVQRCSANTLAAYLSDLALLLSAALSDPMLLPCATGRLLGPLCDLAPSAVLMQSGDLCHSILPHIGHRSVAVRLAAVHALELLLSVGAHEIVRDMTGYREYNVIDVEEFFGKKSRENALAKLVQDSSARVRARTAVLLGSTLESHPHRHDYETLLMPYFQTLQSDSQREVRMLAHSFFVVLHLSYAHDPALEQDAVAQTHPLLTERVFPAIGTGMQMIGRKFVPRLQPAALQELEAWTEATRENAARLVQQLLMLAHGAYSQHVVGATSVQQRTMMRVADSALSKRAHWVPVWDGKCEAKSEVTSQDTSEDNTTLLYQHLTHLTTFEPMYRMVSLDASVWALVALSQRASPLAQWPPLLREMGVSLPLQEEISGKRESQSESENQITMESQSLLVQNSERTIMSRQSLQTATVVMVSGSPQGAVFAAAALWRTYMDANNHTSMEFPVDSTLPLSVFLSALYTQLRACADDMAPLTHTDIRGRHIKEIQSVQRGIVISRDYSEQVVGTVTLQQLRTWSTGMLLGCMGQACLAFAALDPDSIAGYSVYFEQKSDHYRAHDENTPWNACIQVLLRCCKARKQATADAKVEIFSNLQLGSPAEVLHHLSLLVTNGLHPELQHALHEDPMSLTHAQPINPKSGLERAAVMFVGLLIPEFHKEAVQRLSVEATMEPVVEASNVHLFLLLSQL